MKLHLFDGYGIEIEYMIVNKNTLEINPIAAEILKDDIGYVQCELNKGKITYSNELMAHLIELKTSIPEKSLIGLDKLFHKEIENINALLNKYDSILLGTAMHPLFDTSNETVLWSHGDDSIYKAFSKIFNCKGHGFSNIQSVHINLPFQGDKEFAALHTAIRLVLPIIPALSASSPIADSKPTGFDDSRLEFYRNNQNNIPSIAGDIIPELVLTQNEYQSKILDKIYNDIAPFDKDKILQFEWLNSRGAIARFDRDSIEIRLIDTQESPRADLAICCLIISIIKKLVSETFVDFESQKKWNEKELNKILLSTIKDGGNSIINNKDYLKIFGIDAESVSANKLWTHIYKNILANDEELGYYSKEIETLLNEGTLSERILKVLKNDYSKENIFKVYNELTTSLMENTLYV